MTDMKYHMIQDAPWMLSKNPKQIHSWVFPIPTSEGLGFLEASSRYVSAREPQQKITSCENPRLKTSFLDAEKCQKILSGHTVT